MTDDAAVYRRFPLEIFNEGKLELIDELTAEDFVEHAELPPGFPPGRAGIGAFVTAIRSAFPDFRYEILLQTQDGDLHVGLVRASGTMEGEFMGMPASGKSATWDEVHIGRIQDGRLTEHWTVQDRLGMLQQLGFVPGPPG
ncbi:MAG: ester cyclase [Acidimicrobiales bacterium]